MWRAVSRAIYSPSERSSASLNALLRQRKQSCVRERSAAPRSDTSVEALVRFVISGLLAHFCFPQRTSALWSALLLLRRWAVSRLA